LPGSDGGLVGRLSAVDVNLTSLETLGTTAPVTEAQTTQITGGGTGATPIQVQILNQAANQPDASLLSGAHILFLTGAAGALAAVRLVAGLLLALGPFFIAFLLFEATRGLFEGWIRVLAATAIGAAGTAIVLGVELALVETWLADLVARRLASVPVPGVATQLFATFLMFALVLAAMVIGSAWVALGFRLPPAWRASFQRVAGDSPRDGLRFAPVGATTGHVPAEGRSRAAAVADAVAATQRRENAPAATAQPGIGAGAALVTVAGSASGAPSRAIGGASRGRDMPPPVHMPLGQNYRHKGRVSRTAERRGKT
jgi:type IV secretion system protein VirB6